MRASDLKHSKKVVHRSVYLHTFHNDLSVENNGARVDFSSCASMAAAPNYPLATHQKNSN